MSNQLESISLLKDGSNIVFKLNAVPDTILNQNWAKVEIGSNGWDKAFSNFASSFTNADKQPLFKSGLYKATGNVKNYMNYKDGTTASIEMKNGKFLKHSGFEKVNGSMIFMGMIGVQIVATLLQSYFDSTDEKLNTIIEKLDFIRDLEIQKEKSKIESSQNTLRDLISAKSFNLEDFNTIQRIIENMHAVRDVFLKTCTKEAESLKSKIEDTTDITYHRMAKTISQKVEDSQFIEYLTIAVQADELYHIAKMTDLYMNLRYEEPDINRINKTQEKINTLLNSNYNEYQEQVSNLYNPVKSIAQNKISHYFKKTEGILGVYRSTIKEVQENLGKKFTNFEKYSSKSNESTKDKYLSLSQSFQQSQDFLIDNRQDKPTLYMKNA